MSAFLPHKTVYLKIYSIVTLKKKYLLKCQIQRLHPRRHSSLVLGIAQLMRNSPAMPETLGSIPGLGRRPGEGIGYPLRYSCLRIPMDRGVWQAMYVVRGVAKSQICLSD